MKHEPKFYFNPEDGSSMCVIETKNKTFVGTAQCCDTDRDMMSEKTGCEIAYHRAIIRALQEHSDDIKNELMGLKKYYYSVNQSKYFTPGDYMSNMLLSQMEQREDEIRVTKEASKREKDYLKNYMEDKATFYKKVRHNRKADLNK